MSCLFEKLLVFVRKEYIYIEIAAFHKVMEQPFDT